MKVMNLGLVRRARRIDWVWRLLALFAVRRGASTSRGDPADILILDLHLIGDLVMLLPFLDAVKRRYPDARLTLVAGPWCRPVLAECPAVHRIIEFTAPWVKGQGIWKSLVAVASLLKILRAQRWDIGIDMRGDIRNILILFFSKCRQRVGFDFTGGGRLLTTVVPDDGRFTSILEHHERLAACLGAFDGTPFVPRLGLSAAEEAKAKEVPPYVGFHFGASQPLRRLPAGEAAALISSQASRSEERLIVFSAPDIEAYVAEVLGELTPALRSRIEVWRGDLRSFVLMTRRARLLYTMDSGPAHLAAATGCPTVAIFGPNRSAFCAPRGPNVRCVELGQPLPCQPCDQHHCVHPSVPQACLRGLVPAALVAAQALASVPPAEVPHP